MPQENDPGKLLRGGEFYSPIEAAVRTDDVVLCQLRQPGSRQVPRHEHALAYITVVLDGNYLEGDHGKLDQLEPFTAVFNPSGVTHATIIGPAGASLFTIELRDRHLQQLGMNLPRHTMFDRGAGSMLWPGLRLYAAFKQQTMDSLVLEGHVMELLAAIGDVSVSSMGVSNMDVSKKSTSQKAAFSASPPKWLSRVKECLHEEFRSNLRIGDLANDAGVHPVHLARVFRKIEKQTPGDYLQRLRERAACDLMREPEYPLAMVAAECGFADQSHFTRVFKKLTRTTPAQFRRVVSA
jgi:AraC family transcriptional regulator